MLRPRLRLTLVRCALLSSPTLTGGLLGGYVGDWAARRWPHHGRIAVCQFSVGIGVPLSLVLFKGLPTGNSPGVVILFALVLAATGLLITWASTACNNP